MLSFPSHDQGGYAFTAGCPPTVNQPLASFGMGYDSIAYNQSIENTSNTEGQDVRIAGYSGGNINISMRSPAVVQLMNTDTGFHFVQCLQRLMGNAANCYFQPSGLQCTLQM